MRIYSIRPAGDGRPIRVVGLFAAMMVRVFGCSIHSVMGRVAGYIAGMYH